MARFLEYSSSTTRTIARIDRGRMVLLAVQYVVLGGIGLFIALAIVNTVLGAPSAEPGYNPY
jgi:Na+/H+ antiporter NhaB